MKLIRDAFQLREMIETTAIRAFTVEALDQQILVLERAHSDITERAKAQVDKRLLRDAQAVDALLHDTIARHLDNRLIAEVHRVNTNRVNLIRLDQTMTMISSLEFVWREHMAIIAAYSRRDIVVAETMIANHIKLAMNRVLGT